MYVGWFQGRESLLTGDRYYPCRCGSLQDRRYGRVRLNYRLDHLAAALKLIDNLRIGTQLQEIGREWVRPQAALEILSFYR